MTATFALYFRRFAVFFTVGLVPSLAVAAIVMGLNRGYADMDEAAMLSAYSLPGFLPVLFGTAALEILLGFLVVGFLTLCAYDFALSRPIVPARYVTVTLRALPALLLLNIAFTALVMLGTLLFVLPGLYVGAMFAVLTPAILVERAGFGGLGRAAALTSGYRWPILGTFVLIYILVILALGALFAAHFLLFGEVEGWVATVLLEGVTNTIAYALIAVFAVQLYLRLRQIKEGVGPVDLAQVFE